MLYAAKCYWPPNHRDRARRGRGTRRARGSLRAGRDRIAYLGSLLFSADDLVLCMFEGPSRAAVKHVGDRLGIPCERLMDSSWLGPGRLTREGRQG